MSKELSVIRNYSGETSPKVTIVIPCYNYGKYLHETIGSLNSQVFRDFEVVVVNDGSTDDSFEVARRLLERYEGVLRITLIDKENEGPSGARNSGFSIAKGEYFLPLDSDDRIPPEFLETLSAVLDNSPEVDIAYTGYRSFGDIVWTHTAPDFDKESLKYYNYLPYCSMYRRNVFERLGGYELSIRGIEDWDFWLRSYAEGFKFKAVKKTLLHYRRHRDSLISTTTDMDSLQARLRLNAKPVFDDFDLEWTRLTLNTDTIKPYRGKKVLIIADLFHPSVGGLELAVAELGHEFTRLGYMVDVAVRQFPGRYEYYYNGVNVYEVDYDDAPYLKKKEIDFSAVNSLVKRGNYDMILVTGDPRNWTLWSLDEPEDPRVVFSPIINKESSDYLDDNPKFKDQSVDRLKRANAISVLTETGHDNEFLSRNGIEFSVVPNGVNYISSRICFKDMMGIPQETRLLILVGTYYDPKNQLWLVENISSMPGNWILVMMGQIHDEKYIERIRETTRCDRRFMVLGPQDRNVVAAAMEEADLLLLPSKAEVYPLVVLEAMSHRLPWIASEQCAGLRKMKGGRTVPLELSKGEKERSYCSGEVRDAERDGRTIDSPFIREVRHLLSSAAERKRLADEGFEEWRKHDRWRNIAERYLDLVGLKAVPREAVSYRKYLIEDTPAHVQYLRVHQGKMPLVSVILPTYNRPDLLKTAIRSVLDQTYENFEVIVVDDGGEDVSAMVQEFSDSRVRYHRNERNLGLAGARNVGVSLSSGKYIAYLDDDDIFYPNHLETLVVLLESTGCQVGYTDSYRVTLSREGDQWIRVAKELIYSRDFNRELLFAENLMPVNCMMHTREAFDQAGGFDENLTMLEDWELWIRMATHFDFVHHNEITCEVTQRTDKSHMMVENWGKALETVQAINEKHDGLVYAHRDKSSRKVERELGKFCVLKNFSTLDAVQSLEEVFAGGLISPRLEYISACAYVELGDWDMAESHLERCLQLHPEARETISGLAELEGRLVEREPLAQKEDVEQLYPIPIIVVVHHRKEIARKMLERLAEATNNHSLVIINSGLDDADFLKGLNPLHYLESEDGVVELINRSLAEARGKYVAVLHSDLLIDEEDWLDHAIKFMERRPDVGLIGFSGWHTIKEDGYPDYWTGVAGMKGNPDSLIPTWRFTEVSAMEGIGWVMRNVGLLLDESYGSMHFCDLDLSLEYIKAGYEVYIENVKFSHPKDTSGIDPARTGEPLDPAKWYKDAGHQEQRALFKHKWAYMLPTTRGFRDEGFFYNRVDELAKPIADMRREINEASKVWKELGSYVKHLERECTKRGDYIGDLGDYTRMLEGEIKRGDEDIGWAKARINKLEKVIADRDKKLEATDRRIEELSSALQTRLTTRLADFLRRQRAKKRARKVEGG